MKSKLNQVVLFLGYVIFGSGYLVIDSLSVP